MRNRFFLTGLATLALLSHGDASFDSIIVESRMAGGATNSNPPYAESGTWADSMAKSSATGLSGSGSRYTVATNGPSFSVKPTLAVPGGVYSVEVTQPGPASQSSNIVVSISQVGCSGLPEETIAFQRTNANQWKWVGNITLDPEVTAPEITFSAPIGSDLNGRFYSDSVRFIQQEQVIIESRGSGGVVNTNSGEYAETGTWWNSTVKSSAAGLKGGGSRTAWTAAGVTVRPNLGKAGGVYAVAVTQNGPASQSADIVVSIGQSGCSGLPETTTAFRRTGGNTWKTVGTLYLNEGVVSPEITFSYLSGTLNDATGRFYFDGIRFLRLDIAPTITMQPSSQETEAGAPVTFVAGASGAPALSWQWRRNGTNLAGATGSSLALQSVQPGDAGNYTAVVSNQWGSATTTIATLAVTGGTNGMPVIELQPQDQFVSPGTDITFSVSATGTGPMSYQWRFNGEDLVDGGRISGATTPTLSLASVQMSDVGNYSVRITNPVGTMDSSEAALRLTSTQSMVIVESRLPGEQQNTSPPYAELQGNWQTSQLKSTALDVTAAIGSRFSTTTNAAFKVMPALQPSRSYVVQITHGAAASVSTDLIVSISQLHCTGLPTTTTAFRASNANTWETIGTITLGANPMPEITFSYQSGTNRFYADAVRFVDTSEPCLAATMPALSTVTGPLAAGQTFVNVPNVSGDATKVSIYANGTLLAEKSSGITAGLNVVTTPALVKGDQITATQTDTAGTETCRPQTGWIVGGGENPKIRVSLSIRENTTLVGPVGISGVDAEGPMKFLGATGPVDGFGTAPLGGRVIEPSGCWQTVTFLRGEDPLNPFDPSYVWFGAGGTSNNIMGDFGVLEAIAISIEDSDSGPYRVYIDNVMNGETMLADFEGRSPGTTNVFLMHPAHSATTQAYLGATQPLVNPNLTAVTTNQTDGGSNSLMLNWQFRTAEPQSWVRFTTTGSGTPNPVVDLRQPISFRILVLPLGQTQTNYVSVPSEVEPFTIPAGFSIDWSFFAQGNGVVSFQWYFDGQPINGATNQTYRQDITRLDQAGDYTVVMRNGCAVSTVTRSLTVEIWKPTISPAPQSQTAFARGTATLSARAYSFETLSAEWRRNGVPIATEVRTNYSYPTDFFLVLTNLAAHHAGIYELVLTNPGGSTTSAPAVLTITNIPTDVNGDGQPDILRRTTNGFLTVSLLNTNLNISGTNTLVRGQPVPLGWKLAAQGDINNDGQSDIIWQNPNRVLIAWLIRGTNVTSVWLRGGQPLALGWRLAAMGDLSGDGRDDLLFQHSDGRISMWRMNGTNVAASLLLNNGRAVANNWKLAAAGDLTKDGKDDLLWQHSTNGVAVWRMLGTTVQESFLLATPFIINDQWRPIDVVDLNRDGSGDIIWQHTDDRLNAWLMNGRMVLRTKPITP